MGNKYRYLVKNLGLMTISNFASKILSLVLIPFYTRVLTTREYGIYDLYSVTCFLLTPLLSVCIADAVLRFTLERKKKPSSIFCVSIKFYVRACMIIIGLVVINNCFGIIGVFEEYSLYLILYFASNLLSDIMIQFARGLERVFDVAVAGILSSVTLLSSSVLLLIIFPMGVEGYFIAYCASFMVAAVYLILRTKAWRYFEATENNRDIQKEMTNYSAPFVFNLIGWWINNVSDRYIVTWLCGTVANGVYSVAYKLPSVLTMFQTIFNQAWTISAVKEFDNSNCIFYSNIYRMYNTGMVMVCSILIVLNKLIAMLLFGKEFYNAWMYAPFLMISAVFVSLSGLFDGIFNAAKASKVIAQTTTVGAVVNLVLNMALVYLIGPLGAAVATMVSYALIWAIRLRKVKAIIELSVELKRDVTSYILLVGQALLLFAKVDNLIVQGGEVLIFMIIVVMYKNNLSLIIKQVLSKISKIKKGESNIK